RVTRLFGTESKPEAHVKISIDPNLSIAAIAGASEVVAPRAAPRFQIGTAVFSMSDHERPPSLAAHQPARVTVAHNSTRANCRALTIADRTMAAMAQSNLIFLSNDGG